MFGRQLELDSTCRKTLMLISVPGQRTRMLLNRFQEGRLHALFSMEAGNCFQSVGNSTVDAVDTGECTSLFSSEEYFRQELVAHTQACSRLKSISDMSLWQGHKQHSFFDDCSKQALFGKCTIESCLKNVPDIRLFPTRPSRLF